MNRRYWLALGLLVGGLGFLHALSDNAWSQFPQQEPVPTLTQRLAKRWGMKEQEVQKRLQELGQEIEADLARGQTAAVPGLGTIQVVRVMPHRETIGGRPVMVEKNTVQLLPAGSLDAVANSPGARAVTTILPSNYFYHDLPYGAGNLDRTREFSTGSARPANPVNKPSQKVGGRRRP